MALKDETPVIRNPWIPNPGRILKALPRPYRNMYFNKAITQQICKVHGPTMPDYNLYHSASINIKAPPRIPRGKYEAGIREKIESAFRMDDRRYIRNFILGQAVTFLGAVCIIFFGVRYSPNFSKAVLATLITLVIYTAYLYLENLIAILGGKYVVAWRVVLLTAGVWAGHEAIVSRKVYYAAQWWQLPLWTTVVVIASASACVALIGITSSYSSSSEMPSHLDAAILSGCLYIYHLVTTHKDHWGRLSYQQNISEVLEEMAGKIEKYLPKRIGQGRGNAAEIKTIATEIAEGIRTHRDDALREDGRKSLRDFSNYYAVVVYNGAWLDLPRAEVAKKGLPFAKSFRTIAVSILPAGVMLLLRSTDLIDSSYQAYGWFGAALWFVASIGSWIDPDLGSRLKVVQVFGGILSASKDPSD